MTLSMTEQLAKSKVSFELRQSVRHQIDQLKRDKIHDPMLMDLLEHVFLLIEWRTDELQRDMETIADSCVHSHANESIDGKDFGITWT